MLAEQGDYVRPDGGIANPLAFGAGFAPSGIDLESYFDIPVTHTLSAIKSGLDPIDAMRSGRRTLRQMAMQAIEDTSISAMGVSITQRSGVGYVRVESPDCCPRCAILAGKYFRHNNDFLRHPKCHGRTIPNAKARTRPRNKAGSLIRWNRFNRHERGGAGRALRNTPARRPSETAPTYTRSSTHTEACGRSDAATSA